LFFSHNWTKIQLDVFIIKRVIKKEKIMTIKDFKQIKDYLWEIPTSFRSEMRVPARFYASSKMFSQILNDRSLEQLVNVSTLPGIFRYSLAMPDIHEGYGFPIGGVAAFEIEKGIISPGGVGYDINCGVRLLISKVYQEEINSYLNLLADELQKNVPSGLGRGGKIKLKIGSLERILEGGAKELIEKGYGVKEDLESIESSGRMEEARAKAVSERAKRRGLDQLGTLGSGNHFLEVQKVEEIYHQEVAEKFGLKKGLITIMIHTGSRGLGHQVCTDYVRLLDRKRIDWKIKLVDRELVYAPWQTEEAQRYFQAMAGAANFAWANRQMITYLVRQVWENVLGKKGLKSELKLLYDVAHNIAKIEEHFNQRLIVHRKGATRAFPAGHSALSDYFKSIGQPVLIPGSMGTSSYVLIGTDISKESFYSVCHGAGRIMSRREARRKIVGSELRKKLERQKVIIRCSSNAGLAEEAPTAYKNVDEVVEVVAKSGLAKKVAKLKPLIVIKGD